MEGSLLGERVEKVHGIVLGTSQFLPSTRLTVKLLPAFLHSCLHMM